MNPVSRGTKGRSLARFFGRAGAFLLVAVGLVGCAQSPQYHHTSTREYFSPKIYGAASPRVVAEGQPIPRGGGIYLVGHPYKVAGRTYVPKEVGSYAATGMASWYGDAFQGRRTANGEVYDKDSISAAHPTMPLPSYARVTNLGNGRSIIVRVNDRGPYHGGRVMDVSSRVADALDFKGEGTARIKVEYVGRAALEGSDDAMLLATLRVDGAPATLDGLPKGPVLVAGAVLAPVETIAGALTAPAPAKPAPAPVAPQPEPVAVATQPERPIAVNAPTPPSRPFDLGTIPNAAIPVAFTGAAVLPPPRPSAQGLSSQSALYFADDGKLRLRLERGRGPFAHLNIGRFVPLNEIR
jgi:rare lipoprotein A